MLKRMIGLLMPVALLASAGCSHMNAYTGAAAGAGLGSGIGAAVWAGAVTGSTTLAGAGVGALGLGLAGALIGNHIQVSALKDQIASLEAERDSLKAALDAANAENESLRARIAELEAEIAALRARIAELEAGVPGRVEAARFTVANDILFAPGKANLTAEGKAVLDAVASDIASNHGGKPVAVEGHTDSDPISASGWKSNWELGAARALAVLHYLEDSHGIAGAHMSATTYSFHKPVADNDTAEGKALNRRCEIVVYEK